MMKKAQKMREACCLMVLHGGRPDPAEVVDALSEIEAERDKAQQDAVRSLAAQMVELIESDLAEADWERACDDFCRRTRAALNAKCGA